tara:strand:- start:775 stop:915 length:141 start_codon:yes stop_codon:yes gene_type:complete
MYEVWVGGIFSCEFDEYDDAKLCADGFNSGVVLIKKDDVIVWRKGT